jgi:hypothetical protein
VIKALKICKRKFKSILKFKYNFQLLKDLLSIFSQALRIINSFANEVFFIHNIIGFIFEYKQFILLLMFENVFMTRVVCILYLFLLGLFGVILGFLLRIYVCEQEIYIFVLLRILKILYSNGLGYILFEPEKSKQFFKLSSKTVEQISMRPLKILLKKSNQIPFPILNSQFLSIDIDFIWQESKSYKVELFKFYQSLNDKLKQ